jgi:uncharacterized protein
VTLPNYPAPQWPLAKEFWAGMAVGELRLPRCPLCGAWQWYPNDAGTECGLECEWITLAGTGMVFTHTTVRRPFLPGQTRDEVPFTVALIEPDGAPGVRLAANLAPGVEPIIGMRVEFERIDVDGRMHPVFVPCKNG